MIVGRCADYVLRNSGNCLKVFFSAPLVSRIRRVAQRQNISEGEAKATVQKNEKLRADNYRYYTRRMWGAAENFDLSLNTDLGEEFRKNGKQWYSAKIPSFIEAGTFINYHKETNLNFSKNFSDALENT